MQLRPSILCLLLLAACGGSGTTADQACTDSAKAQCAKLDQCRHNGVADAYGTMGICITRIHDNCVRLLGAPGNSGSSPDTVEGCATALPAQGCQDYLQGNTVAGCQPNHGDFAAGAACAYSGQCQSGFCAVPRGSLCGTCKAPPAIGDPCTNSGCGINQVCSPMQTCQAWVAQGGACDTMNRVCAPGQTCVIAANAQTGTCMASLQTAGATCDYKRQTAAGCDFNAGLYCAVTNKCVALNYVAAGAMCGSPDKGMTDNACTGGAACYTPVAGMPSKCLALAKEGDSCDISAGPACLSLGRCVVSGGGTAGTCALPDPAKCM